jgi:hypothetical protein
MRGIRLNRSSLGTTLLTANPCEPCSWEIVGSLMAGISEFIQKSFWAVIPWRWRGRWIKEMDTFAHFFKSLLLNVELEDYLALRV